MSSDRIRHPSLYEVNIRVLVNSFSSPDRRATLADIPDAYWKELKSRNIHWVWLMGVWRLTEKSIQGDVIPETMMSEFEEILPDISDTDIDGSTFAIDDYVVDPILGGKEELLALKKKLNSMGMWLMLDFIPNHYGAHTHWLRTHPEYFIEVGDNAFQIDSTTFFQPLTMPNKYFAHGKDPYFDAWQDTLQVDYSFEGTREWMTDQLLNVAEVCDGVRCDMAMLPVQRIFQKTWGSYVKWNGDEFWIQAIQRVKEVSPDFLLLAEVYWDMEAELLEMGFDYCYDKTFYDRLVDPEALNAHFNADIWYLERTARFLENHDEERIASRVGVRQHMAAAALVAFSPGLRFWHMGQWLGRAVKVPVQINRAPNESCGCLLWDESKDFCQCIDKFYSVLFDLADREVFRSGTWEKIETPQDGTNGVFIWKWYNAEEIIAVVVNFSEHAFTFSADDLKLDAALFEAQIFPAVVEGSVASSELRPWDLKLYRSTR